jgi:hemerythrin-like domain-containing protein
MTATIDFRSPSGGFDEPLELWLACHERVQRFCALLDRLRRHVEQHGADSEAAESATSIRRYFNEAAPRHHADEEIDLFPRLLRRLDERSLQIDGAEAARVRSAIDTLTAEHRANDAVWTALDATLAQIEQGVSARLDAGQVESFGLTYRQHIKLEESLVMPALQSHLSEADWKEVGTVMARRRGVVP